MPWRKMGTTIILSMTLISLTCTAQEPIPSGVILESPVIEEPELIWHVWPKSMLEASPTLSPELIDTLRIQDWASSLKLIDTALSKNPEQDTAMMMGLRPWIKLHHNTKAITPTDINHLDDSPFSTRLQRLDERGAALLHLKKTDTGIQTLRRINPRQFSLRSRSTGFGPELCSNPPTPRRNFDTFVSLLFYRHL